LRIILICILASFVISGLLNPIGIISGPVSESLNITNSDAVALFSYFTFGVFAGYLLSFYIFDYVRLKIVVIGSYLLLALSITILYLNNELLSYCLFLIGIFASLEVCAASTLASWTWTEKPRQTVLIAQDAMFNGGGIAFTALTTYLLTQKFHWASIYLVVGIIAISVSLLAATTKIKEVSANTQDTTKTVWNLGVIGVGMSILLFMLAKISIFIWAPQYAAEAFGATMEESGSLLTNIFTGAFIGSLAGTYIVSKIPIE
jgi:fucose permease